PPGAGDTLSSGRGWGSRWPRWRRRSASTSPRRATGTRAASCWPPCWPGGSPAAPAPRRALCCAALRDRWFADRAGAEVRAVLGRTSVLWTVYRSVAELVGSDEVRANPMMREVDQPGVGRYLARGSPIRAGERPVVRAPVLGEHTAAVLAGWLGLSDREIRELHE